MMDDLWGEWPNTKIRSEWSEGVFSSKGAKWNPNERKEGMFCNSTYLHTDNFDKVLCPFYVFM